MAKILNIDLRQTNHRYKTSNCLASLSTLYIWEGLPWVSPKKSNIGNLKRFLNIIIDIFQILVIPSRLLFFQERKITVFSFSQKQEILVKVKIRIR